MKRVLVTGVVGQIGTDGAPAINACRPSIRRRFRGQFTFNRPLLHSAGFAVQTALAGCGVA
jgi:hypothetical protein